MLCAALMDQQQQPLYYPLLDAPLSPSIRNLQALIETAWKEGVNETILLSEFHCSSIRNRF